MNDREAAGRAELVAEIARLEAENGRLRSLLGLDDRSGDGHATAWSPMLLPEVVSSAPVESSSSTSEKLALLSWLFGARSDVYATRWENASTGKAGWSPATRGGWSRQRSRQDYLPLTDEVFAAHLEGRATIGIYPLLRGDTCSLLACDFDKGTWVLDALAYLDACHANGVPAALERSRSGNGGHVWVFFGGPVPATDARSLGAALLRQAMSARAELDLSSYDRFFPSQDFLPKAGFGNLIALPLHGESAERGNTLFLDPTTMEPWPDQWSFLSSVARMSPEAVAELAGSLRPVDAGPMASLEEPARRGGPPPPPVIRARLGAMLSIERAGLPPAVVAAFKHLGSIANPEFYEKQRMRFSTWDTPRFISCYGEDLEWLHLPRGLTERVIELMASLGSRVELADDRADPAPIELTFVGTLRPQQVTAVADLVGHDRSVLVAPPGAGKTVMACAVIADHGTPTLVVVDRKELLDQWRTRLADHLGLGPKEIGQIGGGTDKPGGVVDVAMLQSLARRDDPAIFDHYGLVVVDECHHLPAVSFAACVQRARTRRWLGLTATPYRRDKLEAIIGFHCGPTRHEIKPGTVAGVELVRRELVVHQTTTQVSEDEAAHIQSVFSALVADIERTRQICADVHAAVTSGRTCLILTQRTDHIDVIVDGLAALGDSPLVLRGAGWARGPAPPSPKPSTLASPTLESSSSLPAPTSGRASTGPSSTRCSSPSRWRSRAGSSSTSDDSCAPMRESITSSSTTTSTLASPSSTACTPSASPRTQASASTSPSRTDALLLRHRDRAIRPTRSEQRALRVDSEVVDAQRHDLHRATQRPLLRRRLRRHRPAHRQGTATMAPRRPRPARRRAHGRPHRP